MSHNQDCSITDLNKLQNNLVMYGDLLIKHGQNNLKDAINDLPFEPEYVPDWCNKWLTAEGRKKLIDLIGDD